MMIDDIRSAYYVLPFEPFVVRLSDGRKFLISERNHIALSPVGTFVVIAHGEVFSRVPVSNIVALEKPKSKRRSKKSA